MNDPIIADADDPAYASGQRVGQRRANDLPRGTGELSSGTAATYPAATPDRPSGAPIHDEGTGMRNRQGQTT